MQFFVYWLLNNILVSGFSRLLTPTFTVLGAGNGHFRTLDRHKLLLAFVMADFNPLSGLTWAVINIEAGHCATV